MEKESKDKEEIKKKIKYHESFAGRHTVVSLKRKRRKYRGKNE